MNRAHGQNATRLTGTAHLRRGLAVACVCISFSAIGGFAQVDNHQRQNVPKGPPYRFGAPNQGRQPLPRGEHLAQWMQQHGQLNPQEQQRALQREPGFQQLPRETQQRMTERLQRLNSMPPEQRQRVLQRGEAIERLQPEQRAQVRSAMGQLGGLPQDRRRLVARSFRDLRNLPPEQRNQILSSPEFRQQFTDEERGTLGNLLEVSPLLPPSR